MYQQEMIFIGFRMQVLNLWLQITDVFKNGNYHDNNIYEV